VYEIATLVLVYVDIFVKELRRDVIDEFVNGCGKNVLNNAPAKAGGFELSTSTPSVKSQVTPVSTPPCATSNPTPTSSLIFYETAELLLYMYR
jgi:hypothetical protein